MSQNNTPWNSDWRARNPSTSGIGVLLRQRAYLTSNSPAGSTQTITSLKGLSGLRDTDEEHSPAAYMPGCIFSAPYHTQDFDTVRKHDQGSHNRTNSTHGPIHSKYRKLVVVKRYYRHCIVVPMFSFENKGLRYKTEYLSEFISIRDPNQLNAEIVTPDTSHGTLWTDGVNRKSPIDTSFSATNPTSVLHITNLSSHSYILKSTIHGRLSKESTEKLVDLFREVTRKDRAFAITTQQGETNAEDWFEEAEGKKLEIGYHEKY